MSPKPDYLNPQPDFVDVDVSVLKPGDRLPTLHIPITHKLIVGGAGSRLKQSRFNLLTPNFPGDTMVMEGEVSRIEPRDTAVTRDLMYARGKNE